MEDNTEGKKRGRPVGSGGRSSSFTHYNPKRWHPEFDLMVLDSISGLSNEDIARKYSYTPQHVSNILSTTQAAEVKRRIREKIEKETEGSIKQRIAGIGDKALRHIEKFVADENNRADRDPFAFVDRMIKVAQITGTVNDESKKSQGNMLINGGTIIISGDKADALRSALDRSKEVEDVEYEIIDEKKKLTA